MRTGFTLLTVSFVCLALLCAMSAQAQDQEQMKAEIAKFEKFVGDWTATGTFESGETKMEFEMELSAEKIALGAGVGMKVTTETEMTGPYSEQDMLAYDAISQKVKLFAVSNMGEASMYVGNWEDDMTLKLMEKKDYKGKKMVSTVTMTWIDDNTFNWHVEMTIDGNPGTMFDAEFHRQ